MTSQPQLTISQIMSALSRHRVRALIAGSIVMVLVIGLFIITPRKYGSEGKLYVQLGRNNSAISPTSGSASISIQDTRETEIRSVVEIIGSRAVLEAVVDEIGAEKILASPLDKWIPSISLPNLGSGQGSSDDEMTPEEYNALRDKERATVALESSLTVYAEKKTSVISIYIKANSPKLAQNIVDRIIYHTRAVHLKVHAAEGSAVFFDDQFAAQEKAVADAVKKLANFRNQHNILSIDAERDTLQGLISTIENEILMEEVNVAKTAEGLKKLQHLMASTEAQIAVPTTGVERLSYEDSRTEVFRLETERDRLIATYSEIHPQVVTIDKQLEKVKKSLEEMVDNRTESAMVSNPVYESVKVDLIRAETEHTASAARLQSLQDKQDAYMKKLNEINRATIEADQLQRNVDVARQYLANSTQKRGEALAMSSLDAREISDIVIAQDATLILKHISPRGSIFLPLGLMLSMLTALAVALYSERNHLSPSLTEDNMEQILQLPVLVSLPRVYSVRNMVN